MASDDRLRELEEKYEGYKVYDNAGERIGKVDDLFVDEAGREEYIGVKMGLFGLRSTLIPMEIVRVNERDRTIEVSESKDHVKDAPNFDDDDDITPEYEEGVRRHFGLESLGTFGERGSYGRYTGATASGAVGATPAEGSIGAGGRLGRGSYRDREDATPSESSMEPAGPPDATPSGGVADLETGDRGRTREEGYRQADQQGVFGDRGESSSRGMDLEMGDQDRPENEAYREGYREGFREGLHESGGRGEFGDRANFDPSGTVTGSGPVEETSARRDVGEPGREEGSRDRTAGAERAGDENREILRRSDEDEQEEGGLTRVWRRI